MRAYVLGPDGPAITDIAVPIPPSAQILVKVHACALNRLDVLTVDRLSRSGTGQGAVFGLEWAGEVADIGAAVGTVKVGDRVMGFGAGAFAEYTLCYPGRLFQIPAGMSFETAASLPVALTTMHDAIVTNGALRAGQSVLLQGASSGVGLMGLQIAKLKGAGLVIGSSTNPERRARLKDYGADMAIDSRDPGWVDQVLAATQGAGIDLIVDQLSGEAANRNLAATRIAGRIVNVGRLAGQHGDFDFDLHAARRIAYIGVTFRTRSIQEVGEIFRKVREDIWPALLAGQLQMPIDEVYPFTEIGHAFARMANNRHFGKIIVRMDG